MNIDVKNNQEVECEAYLSNLSNLCNFEKTENVEENYLNNSFFVCNQDLNKQNKKGKLSSLERVNFLANFDLNKNFLELGAFCTHQCSNFGMQNKKSFGDGVLTGHLNLNNRNIYIASQDFLVNGGSVGYMHGKKIALVAEKALNEKKPIVYINDSGGARIQEGVDSLAGYGEIFHLNVKSHHVIPQISLIMGPCAGGAVYSPALTDFVFMVKDTSYMYLTGPAIVKKVTFEDVNHETLGGASVHASKSGVADFICDDDVDALNKLKLLLSYLPDNSGQNPPHNFAYKGRILENEDIGLLVPENLNEAYDMKILIKEIFDENTFFEVKEHFAENIVIAFGRIGGLVVGVIANQPMVLAGCLDINASLKAEKFIRFCNAFNIPLISLVDVPGFLPGTNQEYNGAINHGSKLLYAYSEARVPKITVIIRKAYGGAYIVMNSKHLGANFNFAWKNSQIAVMGADGAAELLVKEKTEENFKKFSDEYSEMSKPEYAARMGFIDNIIEPSQTRVMLFKSLVSCLNQKQINVQKKTEMSFYNSRGFSKLENEQNLIYEN